MPPCFGGCLRREVRILYVSICSVQAHTLPTTIPLTPTHQHLNIIYGFRTVCLAGTFSHHCPTHRRHRRTHVTLSRHVQQSLDQRPSPGSFWWSSGGRGRGECKQGSRESCERRNCDIGDSRSLRGGEGRRRLFDSQVSVI